MFSFVNPISTQDFSLQKFKGQVYKMPSQRKYLEYDESYKDYPLVGEVEWDDINLPQRDVEKGFPDIEKLNAFGIMFSNTITVKKASLFSFSLTSDDGTILWLNDREIINNDYSNGMHKKIDTIPLSPGEYEMKIWYFQAYPTDMGVIFEMDTIHGEVVFPVDTISLNSNFLFTYDSYKLNENGKILLDSLDQKLSSYRKSTINIFGHTDNVGNDKYNYKLSQSRADAIRDYLLDVSVHRGRTYITRGLSSSKPIASNDTEEGRSKNRRVELIIEGQY